MTINEAYTHKSKYKTTELEIAAFLRTKGHALVNAKVEGKVVAFEFAKGADQDVEQYFLGAEVSARDLFEAHRSLRALIQQVREHEAQKFNRIGTEKSNEQRIERRLS